jgi:uncharacterized protein (TIGR00255 family)
MLKSMTGFGKSQSEAKGKKLIVEIRSLNSKTMDLNLRIPSIYREKENELRNIIAKTLERGKVDFSAYFESQVAETENKLNRALAKDYHVLLKELAAELNEPQQHLLPLIVRMPDIFKAQKAEADDDEWLIIKEAATIAIKELDQFRADEGKVLSAEIRSRIELIQKLLEEIGKQDAQRITTARQRLQKNISEVVEKEKIDQNRFEQELIYYLEKMDITEEKVRLNTHCNYFVDTMKEPGSGRKLGFISQEIGREINTIGSKANDAGIQKMVVQMKDELEKIKEQLLNVL